MVVNDQDFAVVVGINIYPELRILRGALRDAGEFTSWLRRPDGGGLPEGNVKTVFGSDALLSDPRLLERWAALPR